jgi:Ca2+-binding EF-hand superfamily protein
LSAEQTAALKQAFAASDLNKDGRIDASEVKGLFKRAFGRTLTDAEADAYFAMVDRDADGGIDFEEFLAAKGEYKEELYKESEVLDTIYDSKN